MNILIINSAEPSERSYVDPIVQTIGRRKIEEDAELPRLEVREWHEFSGTTDIGHFAAVIISASPMGDNANFKDRIQSFRWLETAHMPVLGICAGHQFIGHVFGSRLIRDAEAEEGITPVRIQSWDPIFTGLDDEISVMQQHHDSISLPGDFVLLARSDRCRVQAIRHAHRPIYGVQWHAEISTPRIIRNLLEIHS